MTNSKSVIYPRIIVTDILVLALVYCIPALSHLSSFPLYYLDPMRLLLFTGYIISRSNANAYLLAVTIPLFSTLVTGHPPFYKAILISVELLANISLLHFLLTRSRWHVMLALLASTIASKIIYYTCKYIFICAGLIEPGLITTSLWMQLLVVAGISVFFTLFFKKQQAS
jgi:hypothetical protein